MSAAEDLRKSCLKSSASRICPLGSPISQPPSKQACVEDTQMEVTAAESPEVRKVESCRVFASGGVLPPPTGSNSSGGVYPPLGERAVAAAGWWGGRPPPIRYGRMAGSDMWKMFLWTFQDLNFDILKSLQFLKMSDMLVTHG